MSTPKMPFGRYKGEPIDAIPLDYLEWALANCRNLTPALRDAIRSHLDDALHSDGPASCDLAAPIVDKWYRRLALEFHPDKRGGSHQAMVAINRARDLLVEMTEGAMV